jgi:type I restriction-modification system DNA methylase subunit
MAIFQKSVINKHLSLLDKSQVDEAYAKFVENYNPAKIAKIKSLKEEEYQDGFLRDIFVDVLGYTLKPDENHDLEREFKNQTDSKKADGAIIKDEKAIVVIELKSTKTRDLKNVTQQAFNYKNNQPECKYVITSNFQKLRFYIDHANEFEEFDLFHLSRKEFELFYLILNKDNIFADIPLALKTETKFHDQEISGKLYKDYSNFKIKLFENLVKNNAEADKLTLFIKSQKLLDRFLFILFAEDSGLLPPNSISRIVEHFHKLEELDAYKPIYEIFKQYFGYMNVGRKGKNSPVDDIPAYNGGLFYADELLDNLKIDDDILIDDLKGLSAYDFNTDIDVNILGHIFEHSLSEIEEITAEIEGTTTDKAKSKRKKDGVFYTPKYITAYIVENTIGALCDEKRKELGIGEIEFDETYRTKADKLTVKGKKLYQQFMDYKDWLISLKIVDPACGSGAFLNQALNYLIQEHKDIDDFIAELTNTLLPIFDIDKTILENNLYGVDINEESIEIAKLSLWLRTAQKGRKLSNLNGNIKCGNSLISDKEVAGDKAFDWNIEFKDIMDNGGFDVVIGNPPYTYRNAISEKEKRYFKKNYNSIEGNFDLYKFFMEKTIFLTKDAGYVSFIVPNTFLSARTYKKLRVLLLNNFRIIELFDLGLDIFESVVVESVVFTLKKERVKDKKHNNVLVKIQRDRKISFESLQHVYTIDIDKYCGKDVTFNINISNDYSLIIDKMKSNSVDLNSICYCTVGINTGYIKDDLTSNQKNDERYHKMLNGKDIGRYKVNWAGEYIMYDAVFVKSKGDRGRALPPEYIFNDSKILVQRTRRGMKRKLVCCLDNERFYNLNRLSNIVLIDKSHNLNILLPILNSKLLDFYFNVYFNEYEVKPLHLGQLPISKKSKNYFSIVEKGESMTNIYRQIQEKSNKFLNRVQDNFEIEKISKKLNTFYDFDFKTFVAELKKKKINLSLVQQDEWEEYFTTYKTQINQLQAEIQQTDNEIDQMVYKLYDLTKEEIDIVEGVNEKN